MVIKTSDNKIQQEIVAEIGTMFCASDLKVVDFGPLEINCFSICFWVDLDGPDGEYFIYVKVPKIIFYDQTKEDLGEISEDDRVLAVNEVNSLDYLRDFWDVSFGVRFVENLGYIKKYNAIVTKRIKADFLFKKLRSHDQFGRSRGDGVDLIKNSLFNFGASLRSFHSINSAATKFSADDYGLKFEKYLDVLEQYGVRSSSLTSVKKYLAEYKGYSCGSYSVNNFKGIDIRQIFIESGELHIIDPGKILTGFAEVDIARFVVTCRILYWGTPSIIRRACPSVRYEKAFLDGYYGSGDCPKIMIKLLIVKEILKHWKMAHISLSKRNWNAYVKYFLKKIYIDSFYYKLITDELSRLH